MTRQHAHRIVIVEDQERELLWFDRRPPLTWRVILKAIGYGLAAVAFVGIAWIMCIVYLVAGGAQ